MGRQRVTIVLRHGLNPTSWKARYDRGEVWDRTPYGYDLAEDAFDLSWTTDHVEGTVSRMWRRSVRRVLGFDLVHIWRNRKVIAQADAVWTHTELEHLAVAFLRLVAPRRYRALSIAQSVWLWDAWDGMHPLRAAFYRRLLGQHTVELVLSRCNRDASSVSAPGRDVRRIPFGTHPAVPGTEHPGRPMVLANGNDRHRDWGLLAEVARKLPDVAFEVISFSDAVLAREWPPNARARSALQTEVLGDLYARASVVAIPLHENLHASGCTVAIEAVSAGVPIVATRAGGIDEYTQDGATTLVPVGDADAFAAAIEVAILARTTGENGADPAAAERRGLTHRDYIARLCMITLAALEGTRADVRAEQFTSVTGLFEVREGASSELDHPQRSRPT